MVHCWRYPHDHCKYSTYIVSSKPGKVRHHKLISISNTLKKNHQTGCNIKKAFEGLLLRRGRTHIIEGFIEEGGIGSLFEAINNFSLYFMDFSTEHTHGKEKPRYRGIVLNHCGSRITSAHQG